MRLLGIVIPPAGPGFSISIMASLRQVGQQAASPSVISGHSATPGPERPAYKTVFMDDDELCKDKQHWIRAAFIIEEHPAKDRLRQARERQHRRLGELDYG